MISVVNYEIFFQQQFGPNSMRLIYHKKKIFKMLFLAHNLVSSVRWNTSDNIFTRQSDNSCFPVERTLNVTLSTLTLILKYWGPFQGSEEDPMNKYNIFSFWMLGWPTYNIHSVDYIIPISFTASSQRQLYSFLTSYLLCGTVTTEPMFNSPTAISLL